MGLKIAIMGVGALGGYTGAHMAQDGLKDHKVRDYRTPLRGTKQNFLQRRALEASQFLLQRLCDREHAFFAE
jgi:hypothetical protein